MKKRAEKREHKHSRDERQEAVSEALKSLLIFVLVILMLVLMTLLMLGEGNRAVEDVLPFEEHMIVYENPAEAESIRTMRTERTVPSVLAWRANDGSLHSLFADTGEREEAYAALLPVLRELFGGGCRCTLLSGEAGDAFWTESRQNLCVYLRYPGALPAAVLGAYARGSEAKESGTLADIPVPGDAAYIRELFLLPDPEDQTVFCAAARDDHGTVSVFRREDKTKDAANLHTAALSAYIETVENGCVYREAVFCGDAVFPEDAAESSFFLLRDSGSGGDTALWVKTLLSVPELSLARPSADALLYGAEGAGQLSALLSVFALRENPSSYYRDASGARVYLDAEGSLTVGADGTLSYAAMQQGGVSLSSFLGYASVTDAYSLTETLCAADRLLDRLGALHPAYRGGEDAEVRLVSVSGTEDGILLVYDCLVSGLPVTDEAGYAAHFCTMRISGGTVTAFSMQPVLLQRADPEKALLLLPQSVQLAAMEEEKSFETDGAEQTLSGIFSLEYRISEDGTHAGAEWVFRSADTEGTVGA